MEQKFLLQNWDLEDGLPSSYVYAMARTPDGYLWIATWNGLARFDGFRYVVFNTNNTPVLRDNRLTSLLVDREGVLWIGTRSGSLIRQQAGGFTEVDLRKYAPRIGWIHNLAQDTHGALWIAAAGVGVIRFQNNHGEVFGTNNGLPSISVEQLVCDADGSLWALAEGKLYEFAQERWQWPEGVLPLPQPVRSIALSRDGGLWVGTLVDHPLGNRGGRILKLKNRQWTDEQGPYLWDQDSTRSRVVMLLEDNSGLLWCATVGAGAFYRNPAGPWQRLTKELGLSRHGVDCMRDDGDGAVWIGTNAGGIWRVTPRTITTLLLPSDIEQNIFQTVCVTHEGSVWGGTDGGGVLRWHNGTLTRYGAGQGLTNLHVAVLFEDRHTNLWAGTGDGLFRFTGGRFDPVQGPPALSKTVLALMEDRQGNLWAGTGGGLVRMQGGEARVFGKQEGLTSPFIRAVEEDRDGQIWVAVAGQGLFRQTGEQFEHFAAAPASERMIRALHADAGGALWIATEGRGLMRLKDGHITHYTSEDGLPSDHLQAILEDDGDNLWFSSDNGIFGCPKKALEQYEPGHNRNLDCWSLSRADGLADKVCSGAGQPAAAKAPNGQLWFPDGSALATFDLDHLPQQEKVSAPIIEDAFVDGMRQMPDRSGWLRMMQSTRRFDLHFTSPNTTAPEHLRFRIWLTGIDTNWVSMGDTRVTSYSHLPAGNYEFKVAVSGSNRKWIETENPLKIEVIPRFYQRRSVQIVGMLTLLAVVAGAVRGIERARSHRRLERLELQSAMNQERRRIARDIHDDLGSGLTEIILLSDHLREDFALTPANEKRVRDISSRARNLTRSMDEVIWAVTPRLDTLESLITYLDDFAQEYLAQANVRYRLDAPSELPNLSLSAETRHNLYLAAKEAVNNAVKHGVTTEVWIRLQLKGSSFTLSIEDNGKGFDPAQQLDHGRGLQNMHRRLEEAGGRCEVVSTPGKGTQVKFILTARHNATLE